MSVEWVMLSNNFILCLPLLLLLSIFPSIRVFSNESVLHIRWPKYWNFSFSISLSNEYSGLISFRIDWLELIATPAAAAAAAKSLQSCLTLRPHGLQHARLPCPLPTPRAYSNSLVMPSNHLILCHPVLLLPSISDYQTT